MSNLYRTLCIFLLIIGCFTTANAALVVPGGLNPGDKYHVIFVTSNVLSATSANISPYDSFVQSTADAAGIGGSINWLAVGSTADGTNAISHVGALFSDTSNIPIYNQNGDLVSASFNGLWDGGLDSAVGYDQFGNPISTSVWTGTNSNGSGSGGFQLGSSSASFGNSTAITGSWINVSTANNTSSFSIYAMSQELTAVPVPAAAWLFGSGLLGIAGVARYKKPA